MLFDCTTHNTQNITQIHKTITVMKFPKKMLLDYATQECSAIMLFSEVLCNNDIWWMLIILRICHPVSWLRLSLWILVVRAEYRVCPIFHITHFSEKSSFLTSRQRFFMEKPCSSVIKETEIRFRTIMKLPQKASSRTQTCSSRASVNLP